VPFLIDDLISLKPDVLAGLESVARIMRNKTSTIPIVMLNSSDPVAIGLVKRLSHPDGNVTGVAMEWGEVGPKLIELLREILPSLARVGQLHDTKVAGSKLNEQITRQAAQSLGIEYVPYHVSNRADVERALAEMEEHRPGALLNVSRP
jgi:putative ABC transport system substrate-binding protein